MMKVRKFSQYSREQKVNHENEVTKNTIIAVICIFFGGFIYVFFRHDIIAFKYLNQQLLDTIKWKGNLNGNFWSELFLFNIPDALWYLALLLLQFQYSQECIMSQLLLGISVMLPFILEVLQYYGVYRGTFDWYDIFSYLIILILILRAKKQKLRCF